MRFIGANQLGWDSQKLSEIVNHARVAETAQLSIWHRQGKLIDEVFDPAPVDVFAVQKGILALLFGIAEEKYLLEVCEHINHHIDPEWTKLSPWDEAKVSIETLLTMTTGMDDDLKLNGVINKTWRYNNVAYNYLKKLLCQHTEMDLNELSRVWLFDPLGMADTLWVERQALLPDGTPITGLTSTAADLAKLGMLILNQGRVDDQLLVAKHYLEKMSEPGSEENPAWGYCWWNNYSSHYLMPMHESKVREGKLIPLAPDDLIAARGMYENYLYIVPSLEWFYPDTPETQLRAV